MSTLRDDFDEDGKSRSNRLYDGACTLASESIHKAIALFEASAKVEVHNKTLQELGNCYLEVRRINEAIIVLAAATFLGPHPRSPGFLAKALFRAGLYDKAADAARLAIERLPHYREMHELLEQIEGLPEGESSLNPE